MPFFIELLDVLHDAGLPVPYALRTVSGEALRSLAEKPALLQPRLAVNTCRAPIRTIARKSAHCWHASTWPPARSRWRARAIAGWTDARRRPSLALQLPG